MELNMKDSGLEMKDVDSEFKLGQTALVMKAIGRIIKQKGKENLLILVEIFMKVNGKMINLMGLEFIFTIIVLLNMMENG